MNPTYALLIFLSILIVLLVAFAFILGSNLEKAYAITYKAERNEVLTLDEVLSVIARCESEDRHYDDNGNVLRGEKDPRDIGRFQINTKWWLKEAHAQGLDIFDENGNKEMARYVYHKQGLSAWEKSYDSENNKCWKDYQ